MTSRLGYKPKYTGQVAIDELVVGNNLNTESITFENGQFDVTDSMSNTMTLTTKQEVQGFGTSCCVQGGTIVIGSQDANASTGAAYVYRKVGGVWTLKQTLEGESTGDGFGYACAVYGNTIAVATLGGNTNKAVYIYTTSTYDTWTLEQKILETSYDQIGAACSLYEDTLVALIGTAGAKVFSRSRRVWTLQDTLLHSGSASCSIYDDSLVIGCPTYSTNKGIAHVYLRTNGHWALQQSIRDETALGVDGTVGGIQFQGQSCSIYEDTVAIGGYGVDDIGATSMFTRSAGTWTFQQRLQDFTVPRRDYAVAQGITCSLYDDKLVVGRQGSDLIAGAAWLYQNINDRWEQVKKLKNDTDEDENNRAIVAVSINGDTLVWGCSSSDEVGTAYIYDGFYGVTTAVATASLVQAQRVVVTNANVQIDQGTIELGQYRSGTVTLVGGAATVSGVYLTKGQSVLMTVKLTGGDQGYLSYTKVSDTSFEINSSSATDTSTVDWIIVGGNFDEV